jgi:hypothetical protein
MVATVSDALARAAAEARRPSRNWRGYCLMFCRMQFGVAAKYGSAIVAWNNAKYKHTTGVPPRGTFVFWSIGKYGHIAISDGNGYCWSTDIRGAGTVARVPITEIRSRWGARLLGWTEDVNGVRVYTPPAAPPARPIVSLKAAQYHAEHGTGKYNPASSAASVEGIKRRLVQLGCGTPASSFKTCYAAWQRKLGYKGTSADGVPGLKTFSELARRSNWRVVA